MSAKKLYERQQGNCTEIRTKMNKGIASFLLTLPIPMTYKMWRFLHRIKGDVE